MMEMCLNSHLLAFQKFYFRFASLVNGDPTTFYLYNLYTLQLLQDEHAFQPGIHVTWIIIVRKSIKCT